MPTSLPIELSRSVGSVKYQIFDIYSMTRPILSVAVMKVHEEGRLYLTEPASKHLPEFSKKLRPQGKCQHNQKKGTMGMIARRSGYVLSPGNAPVRLRQPL